jgi:hypothetical protein
LLVELKRQDQCGRVGLHYCLLLGRPMGS